MVFDMNDALCGLTIAEPVVAWACNNVCDVMSVFPPVKFKESGIDAGAVRDAGVGTGGVGRFGGGGRRRTTRRVCLIYEEPAAHSLGSTKSVWMMTETNNTLRHRPTSHRDEPER